MATERQNNIMMTTSPYSSDNSRSMLFRGVVEIEAKRYFWVSSDSDLIHTVLPGETLQHIAYKYYGDSGYWSVISDINNILNPFKEVVEGMQLIIPDLSNVFVI